MSLKSTKINKSIYLLFLFLILCSCNQRANNPNLILWGETEYYSDFLIKKYQPQIMEQTLDLEFNEDAQKLINENIEFEPVEKDENNLFIHAKGIILYKNGQKCSNNILSIKPSDTSIKVGIQFTNQAKEGNHTLYLRIRNSAGLNRIDDTDLSSSDEIILANEWVVKKDNVYNPLANLLFWLSVIIISALIVCFIISRIVNPAVKFSYVDIDYHDGAGEQRIRMGSSYKLLFTNRKIKYSIFYKFFIGIVKVGINDFWDKPLTIKCGYRDSIKISGLGDYNLNTDETVRKEPFTISNANGEKVSITTA